MKRLIDIAKNESRVFVELKTHNAKSVFLRQATKEGFMIGDKLPTQCRCDNIMIIHDDRTITYCVGMSANILYHNSKSKVIDFSELHRRKK